MLQMKLQEMELWLIIVLVEHKKTETKIEAFLNHNHRVIDEILHGKKFKRPLLLLKDK